MYFITIHPYDCIGDLPKPSGQGKDANWIKKSELVNNGVNAFSGGIHSSGGVINSSIPDKPKFTPFSGSGNRLDGRSNNIDISTGSMNEEEMIAQAIAMSLQEYAPTSTSIAAVAASTNSPMSAKEKMRAERMAALEKRGLK